DDLAVDVGVEVLRVQRVDDHRPPAFVGDITPDLRAELAGVPLGVAGGPVPEARGELPHTAALSSSSTPSSSPTRQTSRRSSSTSTQAPAAAGKTTWSPGLTGIAIPACSHQSSPGPTASTIPCCGGGSWVPAGTTRP